jgi:cobaltochelatase CobS
MAENRVSLDEMRRILNMDDAPKGEAIGEAEVTDDGKVKIYKTTMKALGDQVTKHAVENLKPAFVETLTKLTDEQYDDLAKRIQAEVDKTSAELLALADTVRPIEIVTGGTRKPLKGVQHNQLENLLEIVGSGLAVLLVGPAGTGKSHAAETVADALNLAFYMISVGSQTSKSDLMGYMTANGGYVRTQFREAYENGGVFLLDEADAGNSNVLILLNAALSNGHMAFPDKMVKAHPNFRMIAAATTFGNGASRQYVGRNQLDAATLDRFCTLSWDIDDKIEASMAGTKPEGKKWLSVVRTVRKRVTDELELRIVISPRATLRGATLLEAGIPFEEVLKIALTGNIPDSSRKEIENLARATWNK